MNAIVENARKYIGTPFRHRGRSSRGVDCAGLAWLAYRDAGVILPDYRLYGREPHQDGLVTHIRNALGDPVPGRAIQLADILVMRFSIDPHHVGIVGDYLYGGFSIIHADGHSGRVLEQRLTPDMISRVTHVFRRPV